MSLVITLRGASGSGKSTIVRKLLQRFGATPRYLGGMRQLTIGEVRVLGPHSALQPSRDLSVIANWARVPNLIGYDLRCPTPTFVVGGYVETASCGSEWLVKKYDTAFVRQIVRCEVLKGHNVLLEGLLLSKSAGPWLDLAEPPASGAKLNSARQQQVNVLKSTGWWKTTAWHSSVWVWAFLDTPYEVCRQRVLDRGGKGVLRQFDQDWTRIEKVRQKMAQDGRGVTVYLPHDRAHLTLGDWLQNGGCG